MRIVVDPMPALRQTAAEKVNSDYLMRLGSALVIHSVHQRKAEQANGGRVTDAFCAEAEMRGMSVDEFSNLVREKARSKSLLDVLELERQGMLIAIEAATTPDQIEAILAEAN